MSLIHLWGRLGFDGSIETIDACRGAVGLVNKRPIVIADNYEPALAA